MDKTIFNIILSILQYNVNRYNKNMNEKINEIYNKLCLKIKFERLKRNLTQDELADEAGINKSSVADIENKRTSPTIHTLIKISLVFNMTISELTDVSKIDL